MRRFFTLSLFCFFCYFNAEAQEAYFQQEVNYTIHVSLDDERHFLNGVVQMEYINNSPDELPYIWMHIWPNGYANGETALGKEKIKGTGFYDQLDYEATRGFMDSLDFEVNERKAKWEIHPQFVDICKLVLNTPLKPGEKVSITTPFRVKIPDGRISRLGHEGQNYAISQWFPKPAVYDQKGWHEMPYLDMGEFYSEFGSFDVFITTPSNYRVAATGNLLNAEELAWLDSLAQLDPATTSLSSVPPSSTVTKTLHFSEKNIHDFAWFAAKNSHVQKSHVILPTGEKVSTWSFFSDKSKDVWKESTSYINDALYYYSKWNGKYPYKNCTAVEGPLTAGGGMEYPTITIIGEYNSPTKLDEVITHEVGHNWFYGFLASNERRFPYLDEGINSANEERYMLVKYPDLDLSSESPAKFFTSRMDLNKLPYYRFKELQYVINEKRNYDLPINLHSQDYTTMNYGVIVYAKSAHIFNHLRQYLGDELYDSTFHDYYNKYCFKHVYPSDLENTFKSATDKDLDWFFNDWLSTCKRSDYALKRAKGSRVLVKNSGKVNSPFLLEVCKDSNVVASKWVDGFEGRSWIDMGTTDFDKVFIDRDGMTYDFDRHNNYLRKKGILKKVEPLSLNLFTSLDLDSRTEINFIPFATFTVPGGAMPGIKLHNRSAIQKMVEYELTPMYSFKNEGLMGAGKIDFFIPFESGFIRSFRFDNVALQYPGLNNKDIQKYSGELNFEVRDDLTNDSEFHFYTKSTYASHIEDIIANTVEKASFSFYNNVGFTYKNINKRRPISINSDLENTSNFSKLAFNATYSYGFTPKNSIEFQYAFQSFLRNDGILPYYQLQLSGPNGVTDYKYDYIFVDRFRGGDRLNGNNFINTPGSFGFWSENGFSDTWMNTLNLSYTLNYIFKPYGNVALYDHFGEIEFAYELGVRFGVANVVELYFPLLVSDNLTGDLYSNYGKNIRLMLNLNKMNLFKMRNIIPY